MTVGRYGESVWKALATHSHTGFENDPFDTYRHITSGVIVREAILNTEPLDALNASARTIKIYAEYVCPESNP